jgi:choline dehydrogenase-like flavoprotein
LGYSVKAVPQNISGTFSEHSTCGASCTIGCRGYKKDEIKGKMSGSRAFLQPAMEGGHSVQALEGVEVEKILFEGDRAVGAIGWRAKRGKKEKIQVKADIIVVSAGTLHTPAILLRSGLQVSEWAITALMIEPSSRQKSSPPSNHHCPFRLARRYQSMGRHDPHYRY